VAINHVDLEFGYAAANWPVPLAARVLGSVTAKFDTLEMPPASLSATDTDLGDALTSSTGSLPQPPAWK
jgi:hypothetical protein